MSNQLQAVQAATALQCDEIESSLKRQLVDVSNELRQSQNLVRKQQMEINNLKMQISSNQQVGVFMYKLRKYSSPFCLLVGK